MVKPMKSKSSKSSTAPSIVGMASDVDDDQVLPDSLRKLEIVSVYSNSLAACKANNERHQNPFLTELSTENCSANDRITKDLFGPSCSNCKCTDKPCTGSSVGSIGDDLDNRIWQYHGSNCSGGSSSRSNSAIGIGGDDSGNSSGAGQDIMHSINKTTHFKLRDREKASTQLLSEKKLAILREPILKSIGRSVYHNGHQNKLCCEQKSCVKHPCHKDDRSNVANAASVTGAQVLPNAGSAATAVTRHHHQHHRRKLCHQCAANVINVRVTGGVSECQNDSSSSNKTDCQRGAAQTNSRVADPNNLMLKRIQNWRLADDANVVDFKSLVNECNSFTLCAHGPSTNTSIVELHKTQNFQILQANQIDDTTATRSDGDASDGLNSAMQTTTGISAMNCNPNNNGNNNSSSSSGGSGGGGTNSSSCSQQARMNSSNCDVTIDELASYIEFQLHLPKPMSSNVYEAMFS